MTYSSPIPREDYEKIHSLRSSELTAAVAVARYVPAPDAVREKGRIIFSWSCEDNYHVTAHRTAVPNDLPVLNIMSATDKYFSTANSYIGNEQAAGHCAKALADNPNASIVLIPKAPHTLMNVPQAREAVEGFLKDRLLK